MFRVILPEGELECDHYEREDNGVVLDKSDELIAFVPYYNLHAIIDDSTYDTDERSIM